MPDEVIEKGIKPNSVTFDVTDRCQLKCITCERWQVNHSEVILKELTTQEWKDVILKIKNWLGEGAGFCVSGGEPFLRSDLLELINYAHSIGLKPSTMTNAFSIDKLYKEIAEAPIDGLNISLNAVNDNSIHDWSRGMPGSCQKIKDAISGIMAVKKQNGQYSNINIATIMMPENLDEIIPLVEFATKNELRGISFQLQDDKASFNAYDGINHVCTTNFKMSPELLAKYKEIAPKAILILKKLAEMKKEGYVIYNSFEQLELMEAFLQESDVILNDIKCNVGETNFAVDPYGDVRICFNMNPIGSIKDSQPQELWESEKALQRRKVIKNCKMFCRLLNCNYKPVYNVFNKHLFNKIYKNVLKFTKAIVR